LGAVHANTSMVSDNLIGHVAQWIVRTKFENYATQTFIVISISLKNYWVEYYKLYQRCQFFGKLMPKFICTFGVTTSWAKRPIAQWDVSRHITSWHTLTEKNRTSIVLYYKNLSRITHFVSLPKIGASINVENETLTATKCVSTETM
jgi:hypothetical protein